MQSSIGQSDLVEPLLRSQNESEMSKDIKVFETNVSSTKKESMINEEYSSQNMKMSSVSSATTPSTATKSVENNNSSDLHPSSSGTSRNRESTCRNLHRLLDRDAPLHQSNGKWNVKHINRFNNLTNRTKFYFWADWFHSLLYSPTHRVFLYIFLTYTSVVLMFGGIYLSVSNYAYKMFPSTRQNASFCNMDIHNITEAMYFSLSTMTTIGYGVSDYYFGDCWLPFVLVLCQVFCAITVDAVAIGVIFQRLSRGRKRGRTVIFSDHAVIRRVRGEVYLMFRMGELMKRHLMECHVRMYCIRHERCKVPRTNSLIIGEEYEIETNYFQVHSMRLQHPSDEMGGKLLMVLPSMIIHKIDDSSPLTPSHGEWYDANGVLHKWDQRCDSDYSEQETELLNFFEDREIEIVVLVEGIDEMTSSSLQAKHSYKAVEDILLNHKFSSCISRGRHSNEGTHNVPLRRQRGPTGGLDCCIVDFEKFHTTIPAPLDCETCPYITE